MKSIFVGMMAVVALAGCGDDVPNVQDPNQIVIRGKILSQQEFLSTYCTKAKDNDTCVRVSKSMAAETARAGQTGPSPK
jgi:hypothetical protein